LPHDLRAAQIAGSSVMVEAFEERDRSLNGENGVGWVMRKRLSHMIQSCARRHFFQGFAANFSRPID